MPPSFNEYKGIFTLALPVFKSMDISPYLPNDAALGDKMLLGSSNN
jgi:hypothetical protein